MYTTTAYDVAHRFIGLKETPGALNTPAIMAMLRTDANWPQNDETPWCSAFVNFVAKLLGLPRSKSLMARSWLNVGAPVTVPSVGFDVAVLWRGTVDDGKRGHVGFFAGWQESNILLLGGNQGNMVSIAPFPKTRLLEFRRLYTEARA